MGQRGSRSQYFVTDPKMLGYPGKVQGVRLPRANLAYIPFDTAARVRYIPFQWLSRFRHFLFKGVRLRLAV